MWPQLKDASSPSPCRMWVFLLAARLGVCLRFLFNSLPACSRMRPLTCCVQHCITPEATCVAVMLRIELARGTGFTPQRFRKFLRLWSTPSVATRAPLIASTLCLFGLSGRDVHDGDASVSATPAALHRPAKEPPLNRATPHCRTSALADNDVFIGLLRSAHSKHVLPAAHGLWAPASG